MYLFIIVLITFVFAKIFSKKFRQTNFSNIFFFKLNLDDNFIDDELVND